MIEKIEQLIDNARPYVTHIGWGVSPDSGTETVEYRFATLAELNAFLFGISEGAGWDDFTEMDCPATFIGYEWIPNTYEKETA